MNTQRFSILTTLAVSFSIGLITAAQTSLAQPSDKPASPPASARPSNEAPIPDDDPTQAGDRLRRVLNGSPAGEGSGESSPRPSSPTVPKVRLKARILLKGKPPAVLLDVDGVLIAIKQGDEIRLADNRTLKVIDVGKREIRLMITPANQTLTVR